MFGSIGPGELLVIMALALLIFGPKKLPEIGRTVGGALRELRRASQSFTEIINEPERLVDDERAARPPRKAIEFPGAPPAADGGAVAFEEQPYGPDFQPGDEGAEAEDAFLETGVEQAGGANEGPERKG